MPPTQINCQPTPIRELWSITSMHLHFMFYWLVKRLYQKKKSVKSLGVIKDTWKWKFIRNLNNSPKEEWFQSRHSLISMSVLSLNWFIGRVYILYSSEMLIYGPICNQGFGLGSDVHFRCRSAVHKPQPKHWEIGPCLGFNGVDAIFGSLPCVHLFILAMIMHQMIEDQSTSRSISWISSTQNCSRDKKEKKMLALSYGWRLCMSLRLD